MNLPQLAQRIKDNKAVQKDYVYDTRELHMTDDGVLQIADKAETTPTELCHRQIAERLKIPAPYYDYLRQQKLPKLLAENVNTLFEHKPERRMVRTLRSSARAFLSDKYQRFDYDDALNAVLPVFGDHPGLEIKVCELTETRLYIKALYKHEGEVGVGDIVRSGIIISDSEVGLGALSARGFIDRLICKNGMILPDVGMRVRHLGSRLEEGIIDYAEETRRVDNSATLLKLRDTVRHILSKEVFDATLQKFRDAAEQKIEGKVVKAVEALGKKGGLLKNEQQDVLDYLIKGGDTSKWGMANAVTRMSQDVKDYDRRIDLEELGGKIINLPRSEWVAISKAA